MNTGNPLNIAYIGGGSRFVVTLCHGLAERAGALRDLGRPIHLRLLDIDPTRAEPNRQYVQLTAEATGLGLSATIEADETAALRDAHCVIFSAGVWEPIMALRKRYAPALGQWSAETGPWTAVEAAALWPTVARFADRLTELAPEALYVILANPTDVLAGALAQRFGQRACGLCVEVPQLIGLLAYHLKIEPAHIQLRHIGVNHVGWVSQWQLPGYDDAAELTDALVHAARQPDWYPACDWFVTLLRATGYMRASPYHIWPFDRGGWGEAMQRRMDAWTARQVPGPSKRQMRAEAFQQALSEHRMIRAHRPTELHPDAAPYSFPTCTASLGALVGGLAGLDTEPVSIQSPNTIGQADIGTDAVLEVPTRIQPGGLVPTAVCPPPAALFDHTRLVIEQRRLIARWLAGGHRDDLRDAMMLLPESAPLSGLAEVAETLSVSPG